MHATSQTLVSILICLRRSRILLRIDSICHALLLRLYHHLRPNMLLVVVGGVMACWNLLVEHGAVGWDMDGRRVILKHAGDIEMVLVQAHIDIKDQ